MDLSIPKLRSGSYFPDWLIEPRRRAERALVAVVTQCYVEGVSTRRVDDVVKQMGITGISKSQVSELARSLDEVVTAFRDRPLDAGPYTYVWVDALTQKVREGGRIVNVAVVLATGVNSDGHRESSASTHHHRGRCGVDGVSAWSRRPRPVRRGPGRLRRSSGAGRRDRLGATRCGLAKMPSALCEKCPHQGAQGPQSMVGALIRSIFDQPDADQVLRSTPVSSTSSRIDSVTPPRC